MKLLQRRLRISWGGLAIATLASFFSISALVTGELYIPRGRFGTSQRILKTVDPDGFFTFLIFFLAAALVGWLFTFYQFRRGSWFNPI